jgi:hypothetical protein
MKSPRNNPGRLKTIHQPSLTKSNDMHNSRYFNTSKAITNSSQTRPIQEHYIKSSKIKGDEGGQQEIEK